MNATIQEIEGIDDYWGPAFRSVYEGEGHEAFVQQLDERIIQHDKEIEKLCNFHYQPKKKRTRYRVCKRPQKIEVFQNEKSDSQYSRSHQQISGSRYDQRNIDNLKHSYNQKFEHYKPKRSIDTYNEPSNNDSSRPKRRHLDPSSNDHTDKNMIYAMQNSDYIAPAGDFNVSHKHYDAVSKCEESSLSNKSWLDELPSTGTSYDDSEDYQSEHFENCITNRDLAKTDGTLTQNQISEVEIEPKSLPDLRFYLQNRICNGPTEGRYGRNESGSQPTHEIPANNNNCDVYQKHRDTSELQRYSSTECHFAAIPSESDCGYERHASAEPKSHDELRLHVRNDAFTELPDKLEESAENHYGESGYKDDALNNRLVGFTGDESFEHQHDKFRDVYVHDFNHNDSIKPQCHYQGSKSHSYNDCEKPHEPNCDAHNWSPNMPFNVYTELRISSSLKPIEESKPDLGDVNSDLRSYLCSKVTQEKLVSDNPVSHDTAKSKYEYEELYPESDSNVSEQPHHYIPEKWRRRNRRERGSGAKNASLIQKGQSNHRSAEHENRHDSMRPFQRSGSNNSYDWRSTSADHQRESRHISAKERPIDFVKRPKESSCTSDERSRTERMVQHTKKLIPSDKRPHESHCTFAERLHKERHVITVECFKEGRSSSDDRSYEVSTAAERSRKEKRIQPVKRPKDSSCTSNDSSDESRHTSADRSHKESCIQSVERSQESYHTSLVHLRKGKHNQLNDHPMKESGNHASSERNHESRCNSDRYHGSTHAISLTNQLNERLMQGRHTSAERLDGERCNISTIGVLKQSHLAMNATHRNRQTSAEYPQKERRNQLDESYLGQCQKTAERTDKEVLNRSIDCLLKGSRLGFDKPHEKCFTCSDSHGERLPDSAKHLDGDIRQPNAECTILDKSNDLRSYLNAKLVRHDESQSAGSNHVPLEAMKTNFKITTHVSKFHRDSIETAECQNSISENDKSELSTCSTMEPNIPDYERSSHANHISAENYSRGTRTDNDLFTEHESITLDVGANRKENGITSNPSMHCEHDVLSVSSKENNELTYDVYSVMVEQFPSHNCPKLTSQSEKLNSTVVFKLDGSMCMSSGASARSCCFDPRISGKGNARKRNDNSSEANVLESTRGVSIVPIKSLHSDELVLTNQSSVGNWRRHDPRLRPDVEVNKNASSETSSSSNGLLPRDNFERQSYSLRLYQLQKKQGIPNSDLSMPAEVAAEIARKWLPKFDPSKKNQNVTTWIRNVNEIATACNWTDQQIVFYAMGKLTGDAKRWYEGFNVNLSWKEWQNKLIIAFPSEGDYGRMIFDMMSKTVKTGESLEAYFEREPGCVAKL